MSLLFEALKRKTQQESEEGRKQAASVFSETDKRGKRRLLAGGGMAMLLVAAGYALWAFLIDSPPLLPAQPLSTPDTQQQALQTPSGSQVPASPKPINEVGRSGEDTPAPTPSAENPAKTQRAQEPPVLPLARKEAKAGHSIAAPARDRQVRSRKAASSPQEAISLKLENFLLAQQAAMQGDHRAAERRYAEAIRIEPHDRAAVLGRARSLAHLGEAAEAERLYKGLLALDPRDADALVGLALLQGSSDPAGWRARLEAAIEEHPDHAGLWAAHGVLLADGKEWRAAAESFAQALMRAPSASLYYNRAVCLDRAGLRQEALSAYRMALTQPGKGESLPRNDIEKRIAQLEQQ